MRSLNRESLVVLGNGMAGARVVEEILARAPDRFVISMFGDEPHPNYNRIQLSAVLGGFKAADEILLNPYEWYETNKVRLHAGVRAERIDRPRRLVVGRPGARHVGANGNGRAFTLEEPYDKAIIATGSRPFIPSMAGTDKPGVYVFRTIDDCARIADHAQKARRAVVIGGGLLGLEAARGLLNHGVEVTVVEAAPHLMVQQLDAMAGAMLKSKLEALGIQVLLKKQTTAIFGETHVEGISFQDGASLPADLVVISCGIRPNVIEAQEAGLEVKRAIVVDDQLRTNDPDIFAVGECVEHRGSIYGLVDPLWEQAKVLADVITGTKPDAVYQGSRLATTLKVLGVDLTSLGEGEQDPSDAQVLVDADPKKGVYRKLVIRDGKLAGAIVLGESDSVGLLTRLFKRNDPVPEEPLELLLPEVEEGAGGIAGLPDTTEICNCHCVPKGTIVAQIKKGCHSVGAIGKACKAGTGCGSCQPLLTQLLALHGDATQPATQPATPPKPNPIEVMKKEKDGLDVMPDIERFAASGNWQEMTEKDQHRIKWRGLFFRKQTPGHFMLRVRFTNGFSNALQLRTLAELSDESGKGFCDITTRQQIQMRWFTLQDVPEIFRRLDEVGLHSKQTGLDNVRGICGCPVGGLSKHELLNAHPVAEELDRLILDNREFTNLPRKFNVTITGCLENCCHAETQDIGLVPAIRDLDGNQVNGFNILVGGKQGSGGYVPAKALDVFVQPEEAARLCADIVRIFRDHGSREQRTRARLFFLVQERGVAWLRAELQKRWGQPLHKAGQDMRKKHHVDHLGIHPQKPRKGHDGLPLNYAGLLVPVGRITTNQMRGVADLAERYGNGEIRITVQQNLVIPNIPDDKIGAFTDEPLCKELPFDPSPIMRGLVACTGNDYCHFALIETKGWAIDVARELERRTEGKKIAPLTIHWSGCSAGCGLHQTSTIGLQACRSRVQGRVVDAAHVYVDGKAGPEAHAAKDLMYDVPCDQLADALEPLVRYLPR